MSVVTKQWYQQLFELSLSAMTPIKVASDFHGKVRQIEDIYNNDRTALVTPIIDFMVHSATVPVNFVTKNSNLNKVYDAWKQNVNTGLSLYIPRGLRSLTEQYFRERWKSSFIVLRIRWEKINNYYMPMIMYFTDGGSIYGINEKKKLNTIDYYFGTPKDKNQNILKNTNEETIIIRKPYAQLYDIYPVPYLARRGALYHALFKNKVLSKQVDIINTAIPYQLYAKLGSDGKSKQPSHQELIDYKEDFQKKKEEQKDRTKPEGLTGAVPYDVNFEELIPNYLGALDEKILKGTNQNLLSALGMIEMKGFSSNREESILNPKVLIEEVVDGVLDYIDILTEVVALTQEKNGQSKKYSKLDVNLSPGIIKSFITDDMRALLRSWYDRGLISKKSGVENTTALNFEIEIAERDREKREKIDQRCFPPVTQNIENGLNDVPPINDDEVTNDKKKGTPENKNYKNAKEKVICQSCGEEIDYLNEPEKGMGYISCPSCGIAMDQEGKVYKALEDNGCIVNSMKSIDEVPAIIKKDLTKGQLNLFVKSFNKCFANCTELKMDNYLRETTSLNYALKVVKEEYMEAPYTKENYPPQIKNLPVGARTIWINTFNKVLEETNDEDSSRQSAWRNVKLKYFKDKDGKWKLKKK